MDALPMTAQPGEGEKKYANFDAERHDREGLCLYKIFIPAPFLAVCNHWESATGDAVTSADMVRHPERCFRPLGESWASVKARALAPSPASGWQDEKPGRGFWQVSIRPEIRKGFPAVVDCEVWEGSIAGVKQWVVQYKPGGDLLPLDQDWFTGAKWKRRETPADPFGGGK